VWKWNGAAWSCEPDVDTDTNTTYTGTAPITITGTAIGLSGCLANQVLKWNGSSWVCASDNDGGGDITGVTAGTGLTGGGTTGAVTLNIGAGTGISVAADSVALDTTYTDGRYVNATADVMSSSGEIIDLNNDGNNPAIELRDTDGTGLTPFIDFSNDSGIDFDMRVILTGDDELSVSGGNLNMQSMRVVNQGCPPGYVRYNQLCVEDCDACCYTFSQAAARCRSVGAHLCTSAEIRAAQGVALSTPCINYLFDWLADQDGDDSALYVNNAANAANPDGSRGTGTASWTRCCYNAE
jgi:hypothetical protein